MGDGAPRTSPIWEILLPELPDLSIYVERLQAQIAGRELLEVRLRSIFLLRSVDPPLVMVEEYTGNAGVSHG